MQSKKIAGCQSPSFARNYCSNIPVCIRNNIATEFDVPLIILIQFCPRAVELSTGLIVAQIKGNNFPVCPLRPERQHSRSFH